MKSTMSLTVDTDTLLALIGELRRRGGVQDLSEAISAAIAFWLAEQAKLPSGADPACLRGYQWKSVFLPEGTVLRLWCYGENSFAKVVGDEIIFQGKSVSPNQFAQSFARTTRNAWNDLSVRRPGDKQFKLACRLRQEVAAEATAAAEPGIRPHSDANPQDATIAALLAALQAQNRQSPPADPASPPRDTTPGIGWHLPERRKFRFRLEDVAFE